MARKFDEINELYNKTCKEVTSNPEKWQKFLKTASRNFKLRFDEQLLIYAQKPDATAVLEIERWNKSFGRWVNRGSKGIAVFANRDRKSKPQILTHYFDISDTHESDFAKHVPIWEMKPEYESEVAETLENTFGESSNKTDFVSILEGCIDNAIEDNIDDYIEEFTHFIRETDINENIENLAKDYINLVKESVTYMTKARLGVDTSQYNPDTFSKIKNYNTIQLLSKIGYAISDIAEIGLSEIARTVNALEKQRERVIDNTRTNVYNIEKEENERSIENNGDNIFNARGLSTSRPEITRTTERGTGILGTDEREVSGETPQGDIRQSDNDMHSGTTLSGHSRESREDGRNANQTNDGKRRSDRTTEETRPDEMGSADEQHSEQGERNSDERSDIRTLKIETGINPTALENYDVDNEENENLPYLEEETEIELLQKALTLITNKEELSAVLEEQYFDEKEKCIEYIKNIFINKYHVDNLNIQLETTSAHYQAYQNGLHMWSDENNIKTAQGFSYWENIVDLLEGQRLIGNLTNETKPLPTVEQQINTIDETHKAEENQTSVFSFSQEIIDAVLTAGAFKNNSKIRIYDYFNNKHSAKETKQFLIDEYVEKKYAQSIRMPVITGTDIYAESDLLGITISKGAISDKQQITLSWTKVNKRIRELIKANRYLNNKEKEAYQNYLNEQITYKPENYPDKANYRILSRLQSDCEYFLGAGHGYEGHLWAKNVKNQIAKMREIYAVLPEKPEWLTEEDINNYEKEMISLLETKAETKPQDITDTEAVPETTNTNIQTEAEEFEFGIDKEELKEKAKDALKTAINEYEENKNNQNENKTAEKETVTENTATYQFNINDKVYIGATEYEILYIDDERVELYDTSFPIMNKEYKREEFEQYIKENPLNNHLKVKEKTSDKILQIKKYQLNYLLSKDGIGVFNNKERIENSPIKIAHINTDRKVDFLNTDLPQIIVDNINTYAEKTDVISESDIEGKELIEGDRKYQVDSINYNAQTADLRDITFEEETNGYPIFRTVTISHLNYHIPSYEQKRLQLQKDFTVEIEEDPTSNSNSNFDRKYFETLIPETMRPRLYYISGSHIYWVTKEAFTKEEIEQFQEAIITYNKTYHTLYKFDAIPDELSIYDLDEDRTKTVIITSDTILETDYINELINNRKTDEKITTEEGTFKLSSLSRKDAEALGYKLWHMSDNNMYYIMRNKDIPEAIAIDKTQPIQLSGAYNEEHSIETPLQTAKKLINEYAQREFDSKEVDFYNLRHVELAYTNIDYKDKTYEIEVIADLIEPSITTYATGTIIDDKIFQNLEEMNTEVLSDLNFDKLTSVNDLLEKAFYKEPPLETAKRLINEYAQREFNEDADFSDLNNVPLAYTDIEMDYIDKPFEVEVYANLEENQIVTIINEEIVDTKEYSNLEEMNEEALSILNFDELTYVSDLIEEHFDEKIELANAKNNINEYTQNEFNQAPDFSNLENIGLAYTTIEDENNGAYDIQVDADLINLTIKTYINDEIVKEEQFDNIHDMNELALENLNWDDLTDVSIEDYTQISLENEEKKEVENTEEPIDKAKKLIDIYCQNTFNKNADFRDMSKVPIAYTEIKDRYGKHEINISVDLATYSINTYNNEMLLSKTNYDTIDKLTERALTRLNFDTLTNEAIKQLKSLERATTRLGKKLNENHNGKPIQNKGFNRWLNTFIKEKGINIDEVFTIEVNGNTHHFDIASIIDAIKNAPKHEQDQIKDMIVRIDFRNGDVIDYFKHLAIPLAKDYQKSIGLDETPEEQTGKSNKAISEPNLETTNTLKAEYKKPQKKTQNFDLHPEIPMNERHNFDLSSNRVEQVGKKERYQRNITAIKVLKECQKENRFATPEEQIILSKYVGWGGIPEAFDKNISAWGKEYLELKNLLTEEEYNAAQTSTLTAFFTPPEVINAVYKVFEQVGFKEGNLLEPSCGIGNFIGMLPRSMENSKVYGVELDTISAGIAQQLYQKTSIAASGFENVNMPDSFFDGVIGNVPFGDFKVRDSKYDKHKFLIHDYFFAKSLDKLRTGGIMALVTSKGTMDKQNTSVRKYIAQRADLLGAIRLPNNTFKGNAGTEVVSDILFLQKRDRIIDIEPDWVFLDKDQNGIEMNSYFVSHPEMIMGEMKMVSGRFGQESTCVPYEDIDLESQLNEAIVNIQGQITEYEYDEEVNDEETIPAEPDVKNYSYTIVDDKVYYRENSIMKPADVSKTAENRIKGMIAIRECVKELIELQTEDYPEEDIKLAQEKLNELYDNFTKKYGLLHSRANNSTFKQDASSPLLLSLEEIDDEGNLISKADIFTKRTIRPHTPVTNVDTSSEALAVSIGEKARVDMQYMSELTDKTEEEIYQDLKGVIFKNPLYKQHSNNGENKYVMADEYLSGNIREKLERAKYLASLDPDTFNINVKALEEALPKEINASEIFVRLGSTWIPPEYYKQFTIELLEVTNWSTKEAIKVLYTPYTNEWKIEGKNQDKGNLKAYKTYGTSRASAYRIIEDTLNLRDIRIYDYEQDNNGKKRAILNKEETSIAQAKQEQIKDAFQEWIWKDPERRENLTKLYNEKFNSIRPREYDGSHIIFSSINPEINLKKHQIDAIAHILYGGNTLLAHAVGAGKTYEMVASAMESKRLGLCNKSLFVVPNHLTEQWAQEFLKLYPSANILVATKKDFQTKNRKKFCARIATGEYDAVIIGHSQLEKIPLSTERQIRLLEKQKQEAEEVERQAKLQRTGRDFTTKELAKTIKRIEEKLEDLYSQDNKDDVVTFEELGVDRLYIDESHYYKNLYVYTKMRNISGLANTETKKTADLFMKTQYLDEITNGRGTVFATGTPISNSMVEMYAIQRYLQYPTLIKYGLQYFDQWASTFGETITAIELTPEGYNF